MAGFRQNPRNRPHDLREGWLRNPTTVETFSGLSEALALLFRILHCYPKRITGLDGVSFFDRSNCSPEGARPAIFGSADNCDHHVGIDGLQATPLVSFLCVESSHDFPLGRRCTNLL